MQPEIIGPDDTTHVLTDLRIEPREDEVLRYMGYPAGVTPDERLRRRVRESVAQASEAARPSGAWRLYDVEEREPLSLTLTGGQKIAGKVGEFLGEAPRAAVFVGTAGEQVVELARQAMRANDRVAGMALDAIGSHLAEAAVQRVFEELRGRLRSGETLTLPYSPGYCGIPLSQQRALFTLIDAASIGVELLPTLIMKPLKSVSGIIGLGPSPQVTAYGNPCDRCPLADCRMRR